MKMKLQQSSALAKYPRCLQLLEPPCSLYLALQSCDPKFMPPFTAAGRSSSQAPTAHVLHSHFSPLPSRRCPITPQSLSFWGKKLLPCLHPAPQSLNGALALAHSHLHIPSTNNCVRDFFLMNSI